jgi:hypothetical protein
MARVFLSHSSRDEAASRWLADWLVRQGFEAPFLDFDKHSGIPPGADWERTLYREIASSQALLIVQSSHWNASKWCFAEYTQARALGKPVFQLVGVPGLLPEAVGADEDPINRDLQQLDLRRDRDAALESLAHELTVLALQDHGGFTWDPARPPYPGLLSFDWEDAAVFFGRDEEIRELIERLQVVRIQGSGRLVVLLGASGSGKSSLLRAGVLPRLARSGHQWLPLSPFRPRVDPCAALAQAMANALQGKRDAVALDRQLREATGDEQLAGLLNHLVAELRQVSQRPEAQILISVDQAEELFTDCAPEQSRWFLTLLSQALTACPSIQVVFTLRSDFLGLLQAAPGLTAPLQEVSLQPFPLDRIPDVIRGPARLAGITVEDSFVQAAIRDANTEDALPLLAFALREICERKGADRLLSLTDYETLADGAEQLSPLENAVRRAADGVLAICQPTTEELQALRDAFVPSMVCINDQKDYSRRPARWNSLPPLAWPLLSHLVDARLLLVEQREDERWLEVSHEALLRKWPVLRQWIDACRDLLVGCQQLEPALRDWQQASEPDKTASLLTGLNLARASTWLEERPQQLSPELRRFIAASLDHRNRLIRLRRRTQQQVVGGLSFLLLLASGAWVWGEIARQQAHQAQTRQFQSTHLSLLEDDPMQSVVHGLAAMARLRGNLQQALPLAISLNRAVERNGLQRLWLSGQDEVWSLAETPSGRVISGGRDGSLRFWRADGQPEPGTLQTSRSRARCRPAIAPGCVAWS